MRKVLMSGAAFLTSSVTLTGEEIESLASDESLKNMEKQLSLLERYLNELPDKLLGLGVQNIRMLYDNWSKSQLDEKLSASWI